MTEVMVAFCIPLTHEGRGGGFSPKRYTGRLLPWFKSFTFIYQQLDENGNPFIYLS